MNPGSSAPVASAPTAEPQCLPYNLLHGPHPDMLASDAAHVKGTDLTLQLFRRLFSEGLKVQRERMREARKVTREARQAQSLQQLAQVQALENFYKDQFAMLSENMAERSKNAQIRDNAQATVSKSADSVAPPLGLTTLPVNV